MGLRLKDEWKKSLKDGGDKSEREDDERGGKRQNQWDLGRGGVHNTRKRTGLIPGYLSSGKEVEGGREKGRPSLVGCSSTLGCQEEQLVLSHNCSPLLISNERERERSWKCADRRCSQAPPMRDCCRDSGSEAAQFCVLGGGGGGGSGWKAEINGGVWWSVGRFFGVREGHCRRSAGLVRSGPSG